MAEHVQVRVVRHTWFANPAYRRAHCRLSAVDRLAPSEIELVAGATPARAALSTQLDPLGVLGSLAHVDDQVHRPPAVLECRVDARVALSLPGHALVSADRKGRLLIQMDAID